MKRLAQQVRVPAVGVGFPVRLQLRQDLHLARKAWHMTMGLFMASIYLMGMPAEVAIVLLGSFLALVLAVETARLRIPQVNDLVIRLWSPVMRSCEVNRISGTPYYILATLLAVAIFPKPVAVLSILYLACGDPMASLFGILYGKKGPRFANGKSLYGTLAGVLTCTLVSFIFLWSLSLPLSTLLLLTVVGGIAGGTAELMPFDTDDNFTIPIVSGFTLWLAFILLGV